MSTIELPGPVSSSNYLAERMRAVLLGADRPMTARDIASRVGKMPGYRVVRTLDDLMVNGGLAQFRAGLNKYYATPRNALAAEKLPLRTVVTDSLKSLIPGV